MLTVDSPQVGIYHHVTGVDASSSASLAAYINTLTYKDYGATTGKITEGVYWYADATDRLLPFLSLGAD